GLDRAELYFNIGNACIDDRDVDGAIDAYRAAVERNPADLASHRNLNSLLWQQQRTDEYLQSYRDVLQRKSSLVAVRLAYAMALNQQHCSGEAEQVLMQGDVSGSSELKSMLAYSLEGQGRWAEALRLHEEAVRMPDAVPNHRVSLARALLARGRPDEALQHAQQGVAQLPHDQRALAYLGLCWRVLQDAREPVLNDYDNLVQAFDVPVPGGYASPREFNARLAAVLDSLHLGRRHPPEQTLRGGTQTSGELFLRREPEIVELVDGLRQCIDEYIGNLRVDAKHPVRSRQTERYDFAASWSVRLTSGGFHTMHVHPLGWISSAYYVEVPPAITESDAHGGGLKFGEPDIDIGAAGAPRRCMQPAVGRLVLFPSYMWHGTVPFDAGQSRLTVAFDVVPR
ncbi:MAG TPA: putative 2OG-Fe(II) oxygenase, partial [Woeseiaceae bacterium]|nr:putative 2OG-Fe(II) oxygenase [Woeseiaceae bacterium]